MSAIHRNSGGGGGGSELPLMRVGVGGSSDSLRGGHTAAMKDFKEFCASFHLPLLCFCLH